MIRQKRRTSRAHWEVRHWHEGEEMKWDRTDLIVMGMATLIIALLLSGVVSFR